MKIKMPENQTTEKWLKGWTRTVYPDGGVNWSRNIKSQPRVGNRCQVWVWQDENGWGFGVRPEAPRLRFDQEVYGTGLDREAAKKAAIEVAFKIFDGQEMVND